MLQRYHRSLGNLHNYLTTQIDCGCHLTQEWKMSIYVMSRQITYQTIKNEAHCRTVLGLPPGRQGWQGHLWRGVVCHQC
ncbi:hypothetical protein FR483_n783R [Paramecium bursaria Chlorella virus FR483]|uniref:Uncharacterized protein n783R n=1 Tax=Paramecium bursaria Chlorella virus FR483 TaxID=399781 RepID=A7J8D7_PBCVF|nr:hypothetical protein FR483_n783R [Paramecium bursaria Chlorella virus FR483]ABT16068.1 hypothetical protein FR483_n783R [Paramecium bursaria Chlorella virus FR483]